MFAQNLYELRRRKRMSQEMLAEKIGISRQAIQKWESGSSYPDTANLLSLSKVLHVSMDILMGNDPRNIEELRLGRELLPNYDVMHKWEAYQSQLGLEYKQSYNEGLNIESFRGLFNEVERLPSGPTKEALSDTLFKVVLNSTIREDFPYNEPSDYEDIRRLAKAHPLNTEVPNDALMEEKIWGAWMGRICGCLLGKFLEGIRTNVFWPKLKETGNFPLHRYLDSSDLDERDKEIFLEESRINMLADKIVCAPIDDDTNYTVLASELIERYGLAFTPANVAEIWLALQPMKAYCTAERVAFRNFVAGYLPPESALYKNPYREWIGAQIRADYFGYINPGDPQEAANMAWRDSSVSHIKNGIYGAMFVAAMLAAAAVNQDMEQVLLVGLGQIPVTSRLYSHISSIIAEYMSGKSEEECFQGIHARFNEHDEYDWCHIIPNAEIVAASLLYGQKDFSKAICLAVQYGFDTDCNGATVGSVMGMIYGIQAIDQAWQQPIRGVLDTSLFGIGKISISDLVDRTQRHIRLRKRS
ncbi:MAG: ADP-ribosylglycohydrolase family protein [Christensenellales bacterium]|jgi:transcriptional regulator with XRE-family HTH domain/ADP-ribosylglycohydrolase